jgi:predicted TIM-barrel fold metal-dependent hydrolase
MSDSREAAAAPWSAGIAPARLALPRGATDAHLHIYDRRFPWHPEATLRPADATVADYRRLQKRLGTTRCVIVQPSSYGTDNRCLLAALAEFGGAARGIAVVDPAISDAELRAMDAAGIRGIRFNMTRPGGAASAAMENLATRIAPMGWHVQLHGLADAYPAMEAVLRRMPVPIVIDHLGRLPPQGWQAHPAWHLLRDLVQAGRAWVKLSGAYHDSRDGLPDYADTGSILRAWQQAAPDRVVWGTDWPHPAATAGEKPLPDDACLLDLLQDWVPSEADRHRLLVTNPAALYGFREHD